MKRRSDEGADQVRVMTVHGAKGLEAPIVILPDTAVAPGAAATRPQVLRLDDGQPAWRMRAERRRRRRSPRPRRARRGLVRAENRRLLYVALTRAQTWLIVCGAGAERQRQRRELARAGRRGDGRRSAPAAEPGAGRATILALVAQLDDGAAAAARRRRRRAGAAARLGRCAPAPRPARGRAARSRPRRSAASWRSRGEATRRASRGGAGPRRRRVHRLLEHLHGRPAADRRGAGRAAAAGRRRSSPALLAEAAAVLDAPGARRGLRPGSLAEVEVAAPLPGSAARASLGRIDRLVVEPDRVLAVDFKSNRAVPGRARGGARGHPAPDGRLPRGARARSGPTGRSRRRCSGPATARLMPLPDALVDAALARGRRP